VPLIARLRHTVAYCCCCCCCCCCCFFHCRRCLTMVLLSLAPSLLLLCLPPVQTCCVCVVVGRPTPGTPGTPGGRVLVTLTLTPDSVPPYPGPVMAHLVVLRQVRLCVCLVCLICLVCMLPVWQTATVWKLGVCAHGSMCACVWVWVYGSWCACCGQVDLLGLRVPFSTLRSLLPGLLLLAAWMTAVCRHRHALVQWVFPTARSTGHGD
jgi:hypothetical protein